MVSVAKESKNVETDYCSGIDAADRVERLCGMW
jgi:hypothetical protein